jgi:hypothetical protein
VSAKVISGLCMTSPPVDIFSFVSVRLTLLCRDIRLGTATGFVVRHDGVDFLITNWHVVSGKNAQTGIHLDETNLAEPDALVIDSHDRSIVGRWAPLNEALLRDDGTPLWREHPDGSGHPGGVDVIALPITAAAKHFQRLSLDDPPRFRARVTVASPVHVIGFPAGWGAAGNWPIWLTGHLATDPNLDFDRLPRFLIDCRTRGGMSGSPVVIRTTDFEDLEHPKGRSVFVGPPPVITRFLGVYSGRVRADLDLGFVWRPHVVREILTGARDEAIAPGRVNASQPGDDDVLAEIDRRWKGSKSVIDFDKGEAE